MLIVGPKTKIQKVVDWIQGRWECSQPEFLSTEKADEVLRIRSQAGQEWTEDFSGGLHSRLGGKVWDNFS